MRADAGSKRAVAIELAVERVPNLHRLETFGSGDIRAVEVLVAPNTPEVFPGSAHRAGKSPSAVVGKAL
jgi:hypothetical protein